MVPQNMRWVEAVSLDAIREKPAVFKWSAKQIAIFSIKESVYAIDNRCPHEGYPLAAGNVSSGCVLTCNWHNWKFRLDTGDCVIGGDDVRTYPVRIAEGKVWVDVSDPPMEEARRRIVKGLRGAFDDRDFGRICRETARLYFSGIDPAEALRVAIEWAHDRLEFGTTHAFAAAADWLQLASRHSGNVELQLICLSEAIDHFAFDGLRQPSFPYPDPSAEPFKRSVFLEAIEQENTERAEAMAMRIVADGLTWRDVEETFAAAALAHLNDFGHSVIYVLKAGELIESLGHSIARFVLPPLARHLCYATREDLLPDFRHYASALAPPAQQGGGSSPVAALVVPFPMSVHAALEWVRSSLDTHPVEQVYDRLLEALALNLLCYDTSYDLAYDGPVSHNIGWLDFTHGITMANAMRRLCERHPHLWRAALMQMACMLGRNRGFIDAGMDRGAWRVDDPDGFFRRIDEHLFDHGERDPIYSSHRLKTATAVADELPLASESCAQALLSALNRYLNSPLKKKHVRRLARQAIHLVARDFDRPTEG